MDVIRHEAVAKAVDAVLAGLAAQRVGVENPIRVGAEDGLAVVAALGDVMRYTDRHHPRLARHGLESPNLDVAGFGRVLAKFRFLARGRGFPV